MACLSLSLLGPFEVALDSAPVSGFVSNKARALLAYLAVESDRPHRRDSLAALLWPDWPDASARSNLRNALANLRTVIHDREADPPYLLTSRETIQFNPESDHRLDVALFRAAAKADATDPARLEEALNLHRGPFLDGFSVDDSAAYEEWCLLWRERLEGQRLAILERLAAHYEGQGELARALGHNQRLLELAPWQESAHRQRMRLLALKGQRPAALVQYETCRRLLSQELDVEPSAETMRLYEQIREGRIGPSAAPSKLEPEHRGRPQHNLPSQATPFIGRETQLAEVRALLARPEVRLLTLTGVGGTGKTRLALQVAADVADDYRDGVYWVPLAPLRDPALVVPTIAAALGVRESGETPLLEALKYSLRDRERLLAIDNFEQVLEAAPAVGELLAAAPGLKVLATSRAPLHVYVEQEYAVPPMEVPHPRELPSVERLGQADAVSLFLQRAAHVRPGFALDEENAPAVAEICARLDGLPLAVELAASRIKFFSPQAMLAHIGEHQGDRLQFLTGGPRDAPARQRTLRAAIEWSYDLLDADEQRLFRQLSVFAGGCTLEAVEAVCEPPNHLTTNLDLLESLVDQSLLQVSRTSPPRFTMLETVREYAWERLEESGEADAARDRHAAHYAGALEGWGADLKGPRQLEALAEIEAELDNARAAWEWGVERGRADWLDGALEGLSLFYEWRGRYEEGEVACRRAVEALEEFTPDAPSATEPAAPTDQVMLRVMAHALAWQGRLGYELGRGELADRCFERALVLLDSPRAGDQDAQRAFVLLNMAEPASLSDPAKAQLLTERSLALYRSLGDRWGMAAASFQLAWVAWSRGDYAETRRFMEHSLALFRALGDRRKTAYLLSGLGVCAANLGQLEEGERLARQGTAIARELGDVEVTRRATAALCTALHDQGRFSGCIALREENLALCRDQGRPLAEARARQALVASARHYGCYAKARALAKAALSVFRESGQRAPAGRECLELGRLAMVESDDDEAENWLQQGVAIFEGLGGHWLMGEMRSTLAYVDRRSGQYARAREHLCAALRITVESRYRNAALQALPAMALLLLDEGAPERAIELFALASRYPYVANSRWFEDVAGREIAAAAGALPPEVISAAQERGRARDLWATVGELLDELARYT